MQRIRTCFRSPFPLLFLSALFSALPLTFPRLFFLSWLSWIPFFFVLIQKREGDTWRKALLRGAFFGFFYHFFVYFWFLWLYPLSFAGLSNGASVAVVCLAWLGIGFFHGLLFAIPTSLAYFLWKKTLSRPLTLFAGVMGILLAQRITSFSEIAFPWVKVSLGQYRAPVLIQSASLFGAETVDAIILLFSALLTLGLVTEKKERLLSFSLAISLFCSNLIFGLVQLNDKSEGERVQVALVQGNVLSGEKWATDSFSLDTYCALTEKISSQAHLVIWPESAVTQNLALHPETVEQIQALSRKIDTPIITGAFWRGEKRSTNSVVLLDGESLSAPYAKRHLVPFGERMPYRAIFSTLFPFLEEINMLSTDLAAGKGSQIIDWGEKKIGSIICFESLFPSLSRESVRDGAQVIVLVTNDSWYEDSPGVWQHLAHGVFRSVETGRDTVRCANSGVSAIIDKNGVIQEELGPLKQGVLTGEVSLSCRDTLFCRVGEILLPAGFVLLFVSFGWILFKERRGGDE